MALDGKERNTSSLWLLIFRGTEASLPVVGNIVWSLRSVYLQRRLSELRSVRAVGLEPPALAMREAGGSAVRAGLAGVVVGAGVCYCLYRVVARTRRNGGGGGGGTAEGEKAPAGSQGASESSESHGGAASQGTHQVSNVDVFPNAPQRDSVRLREGKGSVHRRTISSIIIIYFTRFCFAPARKLLYLKSFKAACLSCKLKYKCVSYD